MTRHFTFVICHYDLPSLMAGKLHALLTRGYPKGRDWYDLIWYRSRRPPVEPNGQLLQHALDQTQGAGRYRAADWRTLLAARLADLDTRGLARDVRPFLERPEDAALLDRATPLTVRSRSYSRPLPPADRVRDVVTVGTGFVDAHSRSG